MEFVQFFEFIFANFLALVLLAVVSIRAGLIAEYLGKRFGAVMGFLFGLAATVPILTIPLAFLRVPRPITG